MAAIRIFITDPGVLPGAMALHTEPEVVHAERLDVPPSGFAVYEEKWPPDWVGFADLQYLAGRVPRERPSGRLAFALQGTKLLADPRLGKAVEGIHRMGYAVDIVVFLDIDAAGTGSAESEAEPMVEPEAEEI